jgi:16S rRNA (guanine966-N2)-methyltransferase
MKIIGGRYKGRNFYMPKDIRPTQSMAREALFNMLGQDLSGFSFLDVFAGSGAVGLEAISRGAANVAFLEKDAKNAELIRDNIRLLNIDHLSRDLTIEVLHLDAFAGIKVLAEQGRQFDVIFIDPPYQREYAKKALKTLNAHVIVHPNSTLIIQHDKREILPEDAGRFRVYRQNKYGKSHFSIYSSNNKRL